MINKLYIIVCVCVIGTCTAEPPRNPSVRTIGTFLEGVSSTRILALTWDL